VKTTKEQRDAWKWATVSASIPSHAVPDLVDDIESAEDTLERWNRLHAICKETLEGRPDEFLPMVCSRVKGERDVAVAKLVAVAEVLNKGGLEHANSCFGPDGCTCEIADLRAILNGWSMA